MRGRQESELTPEEMERLKLLFTEVGKMEGKRGVQLWFVQLKMPVRN